MRKLFSGGLMAAALGTALLVAGAMPASAQKEHMSSGGKVSSGGSVSGSGRVSSGATIRGNTSGPRINSGNSFRMSNSGINRRQMAGNNNNNWDWRRRHHRGDRDNFRIGLGFGAPYYAYDPYYDDSGYYAYGAAGVDDDAVAYCMSRFQSYDPASGTYLGYDGLRHPCP
jgi:hypothetical protein